jgi:hypothetical protein
MDELEIQNPAVELDWHLIPGLEMTYKAADLSAFELRFMREAFIQGYKVNCSVGSGPSIPGRFSGFEAKAGIVRVKFEPDVGYTVPRASFEIVKPQHAKGSAALTHGKRGLPAPLNRLSPSIETP